MCVTSVEDASKCWLEVPWGHHWQLLILVEENLLSWGRFIWIDDLNKPLRSSKNQRSGLKMSPSSPMPWAPVIADFCTHGSPLFYYQTVTLCRRSIYLPFPSETNAQNSAWQRIRQSVFLWKSFTFLKCRKILTRKIISLLWSLLFFCRLLKTKAVGLTLTACKNFFVYCHLSLPWAHFITTPRRWGLIPAVSISLARSPMKVQLSGKNCFNSYMPCLRQRAIRF